MIQKSWNSSIILICNNYHYHEDTLFVSSLLMHVVDQYQKMSKCLCQHHNHHQTHTVQFLQWNHHLVHHKYQTNRLSTSWHLILGNLYVSAIKGGLWNTQLRKPVMWFLVLGRYSRLAVYGMKMLKRTDSWSPNSVLLKIQRFTWNARL